MKTSRFIITLPVLVLAAAISTNLSHAQTAASPAPGAGLGNQATPCAVVERGANYNLWQREIYEQAPNGSIVMNIHKYTELTTGLNHLVNGQWVASKEEIDLSPDGNSAAATNGQHQAYFPGDIAQGVIELVTPDGLKLQSRPIGLGYDDGSKTVLIGVLAHSAGELLGSNQVIYPNAFDGVAASLRYRYTKSGFEQDIVLEAQPPTPESFGFNPQTTRLQVLTEFFDPPQPTVTATTVATAAGDLADDNLDFGVMQMVPGKAFLLSTNSLPVAVTKQWVLAGGRQLLVEEVPVMSIADELSQLPLPQTASIKPNPPLNVVSAKRLLPAQRLVTVPGRHPVRVAQAAPSSRGLVLDYVMMTSQTNYTFQGDTTYYISGTVNLKGTSLIEGGTVIKYTNNASINVAYPATVQTLTAAYRPAIFTAMDDNTVGETINGSTGNPISGAYANPALYLGKSQTLSNLRIAYAQQALTIGDTVTFYNIQMYNCNNGASVSSATANFYNAMFANMGNCFNNLNYATVNVQNGTFCNIHNYLITCSTCCFTVGIANSILAWVNNLIYSTSQNYTLTGNNNGFYVNGFSAFGTSQVTSSSNPFQTMGAGSCYLANGCAFTNAGTTNIDATLLASLAQKTTCPPSLLTNTTISSNTTLSPQAPRDTGTPDLGYHYDPIDYITELYAVTNATLTIASGTVIACYNDAGIWLQDGSAISSIGTLTAPIWFTYYLSVQEQPILLGAYTNFYCALNIYPGYFGSASPNGIFQFSKFSRPPGVGYQFYDDCSYDNGYSKNSFQNLLVQDCELWNGYNVFSGAASSTAAVKNTLFARSPVYAYDRSITSFSLSFSNSLFWKISGGNSSVQIYLYTSAPWFLFNNDFDSCAIFSESSTTNGYNAYLNCSGDARLYPPNANDIVTNVGLAYQTGPLGNFYQPANSLLIDKGSVTVLAAGLAGYTTQTNQTPDSGTVDIGYHYAIPAINSLGTDFWLAFFKMVNDGENDLSLYISSPVGATGTVTIPGLGITNTFSVAAGAVTNISISPDAMMFDYGDVGPNGIHVIASQPVSVYGVEYDFELSAAFTGYPTPLLGTNYCVMAYPADRYSQFAIVATADYTTVTITPSPTAGIGTNVYTESLQQGDTYEIGDSPPSDVTGTWITSDKPIGVFAGADLADVPVDVSYGNPLLQEQLPVDSWGTNALALSFAGRTGGDTYRILAANSNTVVTITTTNGVIVVTNQAGGFYETNLDGPVEFQGSQPIQVAQFANGALFDNSNNTYGDPCEILMPPTGHYLKADTIFAPNLGVDLDGNGPPFNFNTNYLNIIVAQSAITNTLVDGSIVAATNFVPIVTSGYYGARLPVTIGMHSVSSSQPVEVQVYGFGYEDACGYFGGVVK